MLSKIFRSICLLIVFYTQPSQQQVAPKQAIWSQSFVREDVPISYKYTATHDYTTGKPHVQTNAPNHFHLELKRNVEGIQYAPLMNEKQKYELHTRTTIATTSVTTKPRIRKDHLEPKLEVKNLASFPNVPHIIPGHNIEVLQSVSRSPGHNAFYRSYQQNTAKESNVPPNPQNQMAYQRLFKIFRMPEIHMEEHMVPEHSKNLKVDVKLAAVNHESIPYKYYVDYGNGKKLNKADENRLAKQPHPQTHKLLLNLARVYNNAKLPCKSSSYNDKLECGIPSHSLLFKQLERASDKTHLYPIPQKRRLPSHS